MPTKKDLIEALRCCMITRKCHDCPRRDNGIDDGNRCAADLLIKIAVMIPHDNAEREEAVNVLQDLQLLRGVP